MSEKYDSLIRPSLAGWAACAIFLACGCEVSDLARDTRPIVNGTEDTGDPAVVALVVNERIECSGALIADRVVVTAAHCVDEVDREDLEILFGQSMETGGVRLGASDIRQHADFTRVPTQANDIAVILLDAAAPAQPLPVLRAPMTDSQVGDQVRIVGFGRTSTSDSAPRLKREGTAKISSVRETDFSLTPDPSITCVGDSGGPAFLSVGEGEAVAGVLSLGDPDCATLSVETRLDAYADAFLDPYVAATAPGAAEPGERCYYAENCTSGLCFPAIDIPTFSFCTTACEIGDECPAPLVCDTDSAVSGYCRYATPSPGSLGTLCGESYDCADLELDGNPRRTWCDSPAGGAPDRCTFECEPEDESPCPDGYSCERSDRDGAHACFVGEASGCSCATNRGAGSRGAPWLLLLLAIIWTGRKLLLLGRHDYRPSRRR